jgi:nitric oxide reductase activation protein
MSDTEETLEAPKEKKPRTVKQQETMKLARAKKAELDDERQAEKERLKAEARFDKLLTLFEKVRVEEPPIPKAVLKKRQPRPEPEDEELEMPKLKATANPATKEVFLRFC